MSQRRNGQDEEVGMGAVEQTGEELPERWSARAKTEIVLRLLKGRSWGRCRERTRCRCTGSSGGGGSSSRAGQTASSGATVRRWNGSSSAAGEGRRADDEARDRGVVSAARAGVSSRRQGRSRGQLSEVPGIHDPWKPNGTRRGRWMVATGAATKLRASMMITSLASRPAS
jgi:hypothetical protein